VKGVLLDAKTIDAGDIRFDSIKSIIPHWQFFDFTTEDQVIDRIKDADFIISNKVKISKHHIDQAPSLKMVCIAATGTNNVDLRAAKAVGIPVTNVTHYATPSVVQHVFSMVLSLVTRQQEYRQAVSEGKWQKSQFFCLLDYPITELYGKTLGIIGYGALGQGVARVGEAFGMKVNIAARKGQSMENGRVSFETLLAESDVISLHCPLTDETENLIGSKEFGLMKKSAIIINTARGGIIDEKALVDALDHGVIAGAGIDVLSDEPPVKGNVLLEKQIPNLIVTPHIAWASRESRQRVVDEVALNIKAFIDGEERNRVG